MTAHSARVRSAWDRFWFGQEAALNLAAARVLVCVHSLWVVLSRDYAAISGVDFVWELTSTTSMARFLILPGLEHIEAFLQWCAIVTLIMGGIGLRPRTACFVAGILLYHLAPFETVFRDATPYGRGLTVAPVALLLLAAAPSGDALAFRPRSGVPQRLGGAHGWALKLIRLLVCQIYLFAALGKLIATGLSWGSAASMRGWLLWANVDPEGSTFRAPGLWLADQPAPLLGALGAGTLLLEAGFIAALFSRRARVWILPVTVLFNVALMVTINAHVPEVWLLLVFVDWEVVRGRLVAWRGQLATPRSVGPGTRGDAILRTPPGLP